MKNFTARFLILFAGIMAVHFIWEILDDRPPVWDMAYHQLKGWEYLQAWEQGRLVEEFSSISSHYPPLYYVQEAAVLNVFSDTQFLAILANLLGLFLLAGSTYGIASFFMSREVAIWAGLLTLLFPFMAWISRTSLLDVPLAGWAAGCGYCLLKSDLFQNKGWTVGFGLSLVAGMLTKWTFPVYMFFPLVFALLYSQDRKRSLLNLADASLIAMPIAFLWYLPNLSRLFDRYPTTLQTSIIPWQADPRHGEPGLSSILGWIYYARAISSYFLFLPLTVLFAWSAVFSIRRRRTAQPRLGLLWWWLLGGLALLIIVTPKDPRFATPLLPPLAVLIMYPWRERPKWALVIFLLALLQFLSVSFKLPFYPVKVALFERQDSDYQTIQQEWVFYASQYFDVVGPPRRQDWRYDDILGAIPAERRVGFIPDLAHFHPGGLELRALKKGRSLEVTRIGENPESLDALDSLDYIVGKSGFQGISFITRFNEQAYERLKESGWQQIHSWPVPDQSQALLWRRVK
ncbi:MAG: ArnT family glycosyltransferase [Acidobacteriota bacterium]